jgi:VIT1/CCC1 family predicted Fe2+/Mn2+ transporter
MKKINEDYLRALMFGLQDGIVSTTGVVAGISVGVQNKSVVAMAAMVAVMVEASSMAAGQYSSERLL